MKIFKRDLYKDMLEWKSNNRNPNLRRKVLKLCGNRQVGKTTLVKEFGKNEYKHVTYINLSDSNRNNKVKEFLAKYGNVKETLIEQFKHYDKDFIDNLDNLIIIDEIQESAVLYSSIRAFAQELNCDVIVTGSYLGITTMKEGFWASAGDYTAFTLDVLSFEEFLAIFNKRDLYDSINIYGSNDEDGCRVISNYFNAYRRIGGYPEAINTYLATQDLEQVSRVFENTFEIFCQESERYLNLGTDKLLFDSIIVLLINNLTKEKRGFKEKECTIELKQLLEERYSLNVNTKTVTTVLSWLLSARVLIACGKAIDCNIGNVKLFQRFYLNDLGMLQYLCDRYSVNKDIKYGLVSELFVAKSILHYLNKNSGENVISPLFGTYKDYEIDFILRSRYNNATYGIEVKTGNNKTTSLDAILNENKITYGIAFKGVLKSNGEVTNNKLTIPLMFAEKFEYDLGDKYIDPEPFDVDITDMGTF